jgi:hypothetical protein
MNASELADKLEKCCLVSWGECTHEDYDTDIWTKMKSATMLRQQEKELTEAGHMIGVLREYISDLKNGLDSSINLNKAQAERQEK